MSSKRRYNRPGGGSFLGMILLNSIVAFIVLKVVFTLFGVNWVLGQKVAAIGALHVAVKWGVLVAMLPGAAVGFACLWYWLILVGRSRGLPWAGALIYGVLLAFGNVLLAGVLRGAAAGNPLLGLLFALVMLLLMPTIWLSMACFGLTMGLFNGLLAQNWIVRHRPR